MFRRGFVTRIVNGSVVGVAMLASAAICHADFTAPTLSTTEYTATAAAVFAAIGAIWGLRKVIKLLNRS